MSSGLSYTDAVKLLGGSGPLVTLADNLLGGALSLATAGGSDAALSLFDAKSEAVRLGHLVAGKITEAVHGLGRYDRSRRLQAAHGVLVVGAFFESLDECLRVAGVGSPGFSRDDQIGLAVRTPVDGDWLGRLLTGEIPVPAPDRSYDVLLRDLERWFGVLGSRVIDHLGGLAVWEGADERGRRALRTALRDRLPGAAAERYQDAVRRLSVELPEFAFWMRQVESRATARGLESLESALLRATSGRDPVRHRAALAATYRAALDLPVLGGDGAGAVGGGDAGTVVIPSRGVAYIDPRFRVRQAGPGSRPADEDWWDVEPRADLADFLATYLTTPQAADAPMLLLGQPGAGKSSLTRVLAARLPAADFLVVRVALREVKAEADIQDQVEQALRGTIGETVAWADLARDAAGAMPVILLDGFDELLQATGLHQSDYLRRVAAFQRREAVLGRPVAVVVTSRTAVADRAQLPVGGLAVRLEPFDDAQVARWLELWNEANADRFARWGRRPLSLAALRRFPDLAAQPLLLLMLAMYDAAGTPPHGAPRPGGDGPSNGDGPANGDGLLSDDGLLGDDGGALDTGELYERLLREFAGREVHRVHVGRPESDMPALVEQELLRLSVVAFAMFHRQRLWVTTEELDADLAGLGLRPSRQPHTEAFRTPLTAGQEMIGRFFFIQRAQARQDDQTLRTYEFLHATFGEYLVARLVVQAVRDAAARSRARTLRLGPVDDDDLLRSLLGFTPLCARATVLPFAIAMLRRSDPAGVRDWLLEQLRTAVTRPRYERRPYQPVDKRADHWMATYSFNLLLLTLACAEPVRASELFRHADDPADWLRGMALQWRAAVPGGMWMDAMDSMVVTRVWGDDGRRDLVLRGTPWAPVDGVDPFWSHRFGPNREAARGKPGTGFSDTFPLPAALTSMQLSGALSDDVLRHAVQPLLDEVPEFVTSFVVHGPGDAESVAHSLVRLWLTSATSGWPGRLLPAYERAVLAVTSGTWEPVDDQDITGSLGVDIVLRALVADAPRLPTDEVRRLVRMIRLSDRFGGRAHRALADECLSSIASRPTGATGATGGAGGAGGAGGGAGGDEPS